MSDSFPMFGNSLKLSSWGLTPCQLYSACQYCWNVPRQTQTRPLHLILHMWGEPTAAALKAATWIIPFQQHSMELDPQLVQLCAGSSPTSLWRPQGHCWLVCYRRIQAAFFSRWGPWPKTSPPEPNSAGMPTHERATWQGLQGLREAWDSYFLLGPFLSVISNQCTTLSYSHRSFQDHR